MEIDDNLVIEHRGYARVGLSGNAIDVPYGAALSLTLENFYASVKLEPSNDLVIVPPQAHDVVQFSSLQHLVNELQTDGYDGTVRLIMALCKIFQNYCKDNNISLHEGNFTLSYNTNIPQQTGLSGSSAILCAALSCLLDYYKVRHLVKVELRPNLIVKAKEELGIVAGIQGPVTQIYGGIVYMNFGKKERKELGHVMHTPMDTSFLPPLYLIYSENNPSDLGEVHNNFRHRWLSGDLFIIDPMREFVSNALQGRKALIQKDYDWFAWLMDCDLDIQREMFGNDALGDMNIELVEVAESVGAACKFSGSGGSAVAYCPGGKEQENNLIYACKSAGFICELVKVMPSLLNEVDTKTMTYHIKLTWEWFLMGEKIKIQYGEKLKALYGENWG